MPSPSPARARPGHLPAAERGEPRRCSSAGSHAGLAAGRLVPGLSRLATWRRRTRPRLLRPRIPCDAARIGRGDGVRAGLLRRHSQNNRLRSSGSSGRGPGAVPEAAPGIAVADARPAERERTAQSLESQPDGRGDAREDRDVDAHGRLHAATRRAPAPHRRRALGDHRRRASLARRRRGVRWASFCRVASAAA